jgi:NAD(P)H-dependent nitrite reductase small subunit
MSPEPSGWVAVARLGDLAARDRTLVTIDGTEIALFRVAERVYAIQNRCPHRGGPLIRGFLEDGPAVRCPMHGWRYDLGTGASDRPATAVVYQVRVDGDEISVLL